MAPFNSIKIMNTLNLIKNKRITPEEGLEAYKKLVGKNSEDKRQDKDLIYLRHKWEASHVKITKTNINHIIVFDNSAELMNRLSERTSSLSTKVVLVKPGTGFEKLTENIYQINPSRVDDYEELFNYLKSIGISSENIVFQWHEDNLINTSGLNEQALQRGIYSLLYLTKGLMRLKHNSKVRLVTVFDDNSNTRPDIEALSGFVKTLHRENHNYSYSIVKIENSENPLKPMHEIVFDELLNEYYKPQIKYSGGKRFSKEFEEFKPEVENTGSGVLREKGVYIITGGAGGLGLIFAKFLAKEYKARILLSGRSEIDNDKKEKIRELEAFGAEIVYFQSDVSLKEDAINLISEAKRRFGKINGIIHSAGVLRDSYIIKKTEEDLKKVLTPKVNGTVYLDLASKDEEMDFFVTFSSSVSATGNIGQCDYAYANSFMDHYILLREAYRKSGRRSGRSLSINWPLWKEGGMTVDSKSEKFLFETFGMLPLSTENGINSFKKGLELDESQFVLVEGDYTRIRKAFNLDKSPSVNLTGNLIDAKTELSHLSEQVQQDIVKGVSNILKIDEAEIDESTNLGDFGFESISFTELSNFLNDKFDAEVVPSVFFEYPNIKLIAHYMINEYKENIIKIYKDKVLQLTIPQNSKENPIREEAEKSPENKDKIKKSRFFNEYITIKEAANSKSINETDFNIIDNNVSKKKMDEPIAIVGMSGVMPGSADLDEFWDNLVNGFDMVSEIPEDRWNWKDYYGDPLREENKANSKWGGFMKEIDKFDAMFFAISAKEAELMDPQQRIFLETVWKTIEDAGYKPSAMAGTKTGLFVGVGTWDYYDLMNKKGISVEAQTSIGICHSIIANRISYILNLRGPSEPIDTACSSSLVAIHRAVESIRNGDCEMAIAGGVNVITSPIFYISFSKAGMLSEDGRCKTFDKSANGYVRGEGAGAVLLKPLSKAQKDGDYIYAVIKASSVNHGGRANSLTAPNPNAQAELIIDAWEKSGIDPTTISYIEAHGTGTSIGDPIEINGLNKAFTELYRKWNKQPGEKARCGIGSVKSNIGHLETAAGIAGVMKIILSMKHGLIPGNLHFKELNPYINLNKTPFFIINKTTKWERLKGGVSGEIPRRAGISSFGFGGVNSHIVLEEYLNDIYEADDAVKDPQVIVLSAKNEKRLKDYARNFISWIQNRSKVKATNSNEPGVYSQFRNDIVHLAARVLGVEEHNLDEYEKFENYGFDTVNYNVFINNLSEQLQVTIDMTYQNDNTLDTLAKALFDKYKHLLISISGNKEFPGNLDFPELQVSNTSIRNIAYTLQTGREEFEERIAFLAVDLNEMARKLDLYCQNIDAIEDFYRGNTRNKDQSDMLFSGKAGLEYVKTIIQEKEFSKLAKLWVMGIPINWGLLHNEYDVRRIPVPTYPFSRERYWLGEGVALKPETVKVSQLHPLVHTNISSFSEQKFTTSFSGSEFFLRDHIVNNQKILPGVACIEMARVAGEISGGTKVRYLRDIMWKRPIIVAEAEEKVDIGLWMSEDEVIFQINSSSSNDDAPVNCTGKIIYDEEFTTENQVLDIRLIESRCTVRDTDVSGFYERFSEQGLAYGNSFRAVTDVLSGKDECIAYIELPDCVYNTFDTYVLHPSIMDGILQAAAGIHSPEWENSALYLPFSISEVKIIKPLERKCIAYVTKLQGENKGIKKFNILVLNERGEVLIRINEFLMMPTFRKAQVTKKAFTPEDMLYKYVWKPAGISATEPGEGNNCDWIVMDHGDVLFNSLLQRKNGKVLHIKCGNEFSEINHHAIQINNKKAEDYERIFQLFRESGSHSIKVIHRISTGAFEIDAHTIERQTSNGFYSMFELLKAYVKSKLPQRLEVLYIYESNGNYHDQPIYSAVGGLLKTAAIEIPKFKYETLGFRYIEEEKLNELILAEAYRTSFSNNEVFYLNGNRLEKNLQEETFKDTCQEQSMLKPEGVYIITGGAGGLGLIITEHMSQQFGGKLILLGRSALNQEKEDALNQIRKTGTEVHYIKCDITSYENTNRVLQEIRSRFKKIDGIIHSAGVIRDSLIVNKNIEDMETVLSPKINGTLWLDSLTSQDKLDFFVLFSSISAIKGNMGQCDYSYANSVMDNFAMYRNQLVSRGDRSGRTISINWPLWKEGGMRVDERVEALLMKQTGMMALDTESGLKAFNIILSAGYEQVAYVRGSKEKMAAYFNPGKQILPLPSRQEENQIKGIEKADKMKLLEEAQNRIVELFVELLKVRAEDIDTETPFIEYGLDSIMMIQMLERMEERFETVMESNVLAEFNTIVKLANFMVEKGIIKGIATENVINEESVHNQNEEGMNQRQADLIKKQDFKAAAIKPKAGMGVRKSFIQKDDRIAVIGAACRFPKSQDIDGYWDNLIQGRFLISEVPEDRWDMNLFYNSDKSAPYKSYSKWGGFLEEIYGFDSAYFGITDEDALIMDPQHRMLLELGEELLCRAGYSKDDIGGTNTGVFIGAAESPYFRNNMELAPDAYLKHAIVNSIENMMAARISDFYDLKGPSQTINTACSSSLVAIHQACQSLKTGETDMAVAGGIFLMVDPYYHINFSKANVLSEDGVCYVFDERAKGFVLGEGAGIVLLKPYEKAVQDGDQILGTILGSAVNNDGHTMGLTVPNQDGQKDAIFKALKNAEVPANSITYLEAHGTGTLLGDPIEIRAATQVFEMYSEEKQYCAVGSVKSNMGHLMTASGVASFIKVILMLKNKMIPPTLNCSRPHPRFRFDDSPFYPVLGLKNWTEHKRSRRAAISSFGFGGTNSHMILEEFNQDKYIPRKTPLALPQFNRKYYRLGYEITDIPSCKTNTNDRFLKLFLKDLEYGNMDIENAVKLLKSTI